jgi:hypothetical protein
MLAINGLIFSTQLAITVSLPLFFLQLAQNIPATVNESSNSPIVGGLISYLIFAFFSWKIFQRLNIENAWFAWIPILGSYITFVAGDERNPVLWTILLLVPLVNIVAAIKLIIAWVKIVQKLEKSPWLLLLTLIPLAGFIVFAYFAFG